MDFQVLFTDGSSNNYSGDSRFRIADNGLLSIADSERQQQATFAPGNWVRVLQPDTFGPSWIAGEAQGGEFWGA